MEGWAKFRQRLIDAGLWFMLGIVLTMGLSKYFPGKPIVVTSESIPTGLYWLNDQQQPVVGATASFYLRDMPDWLDSRLARKEALVHTKYVLGSAGAEMRLLPSGEQQICWDYGPCAAAGQLREVDAKGRPLYAWLATQPGQRYRLKTGEYWVHGEHPKSLDSRFHGPVKQSDFIGRAYRVMPIPGL